MDKIITANGILSNLKTVGISLSVYDCVTSTNTILKQLALEGKTEGEVIIALSQTEGRGRYNRKFYSDQGGIYMSILLRPTTAPNTAVLTAAAAVAVSDAIEEISGKATQIKWVNDLLINDKKVCGILCEGGFCGDKSFFVVGIGINACATKNGLDDEIKGIATTIFDTYSSDVLSQLCAKVIDNLFYEYNHISNRKFLQIYRQKSAVLGKEINVLSKGEIIGTAKALEIDDNCRLLIEFKDGETKKLITDEISIKMLD